VKRDPLLWAALLAVLVVLASAEYNLAVACGFGTYVAAGVPAALDVYAIAALRARRDVLVVVVVLIAVNAASHLVEVGLLPVSVPLVVGVSAIAPLVLWRVHRLGDAVVRSAPEPMRAVPEPAEPEAEPVTAERVAEPVDAAPVGLVLGPWTPVPELLTGTSGTRGGTSPDQHASGRPEARTPRAEPAPEPPEPTTVPGVPPASSGAADIESEDSTNTSFRRYVTDARNWLAVEPELTGTAIGTRLGKSDAYGRRVRRAALADA
jgi:hypothetical protein